MLDLWVLDLYSIYITGLSPLFAFNTRCCLILGSTIYIFAKKKFQASMVNPYSYFNGVFIFLIEEIQLDAGSCNFDFTSAGH